MRFWSERNGRADIVVSGFSALDNVAAFVAGIVVLGASIWVIGGLA